MSRYCVSKHTSWYNLLKVLANRLQNQGVRKRGFLCVIKYCVIRNNNETLFPYLFNSVLQQTSALISNYSMGRDERYFENPTEFRPERWLRDTERETKTKSHPFAAIPFGFGTRSCVGEKLIIFSFIYTSYDISQFKVPSIQTLYR